MAALLVMTACSSAVTEATETAIDSQAELQSATSTPAPEPTAEAVELQSATSTPAPEPTAEAVELQSATSTPAPESTAEAAEPGAEESESSASSPVPTGEPQPSCNRIEDFGDDAADRWLVVNDGVMGGLSLGTVTVSGGVLRFEGTINTNGGGFSLVETSVLRDGATLVDALAEADFLRLRLRSEFGRGYELMAEDVVTRSNPRIMHFASLDISRRQTWEEVEIRVDEFESRSFGRSVGDAEPFEPELVRSIGIILADGLDGAFAIEVDQIDACRS